MLMHDRLFFSLLQEDMELLEARLAEAKSEVPGLGPTLRTRGKRLRPIIFLLCNRFAHFLQGGNGALGSREIAIATALEMIHEASLIHDDIVDRSDLRRGKPTLNDAHGDAMALLIGDYLFAHSSSIVLEHTKALPDLRLVKRVARTAMRMVQGQVQQLEKLLYPETAPERASLEGYIDIVTTKTGLFFAACAEGGAALAGASEAFTGQLHDFGRNVGVAFQIMDDVLDVIGQEDVMGKPLRHDVREKTVTLPFLLAYRRHKTHPLLQKVIAGKDTTSRENARVYKLLSSPSVTRSSYKFMGEYLGRAERILGKLPRCIYRLALEDLLEFMAERKH